MLQYAIVGVQNKFPQVGYCATLAMKCYFKIWDFDLESIVLSIFDPSKILYSHLPEASCSSYLKKTRT